MQDQKNTKTPPTSPADPVKTMDTMVGRAAQGDFVQKIVEKIKNSENILIALSRDPSVDEIAAAIGLTMYLDSMQKHATAIYSGRTPNALAFLQPDATFETNTDSLQDFIIALNKGKADHLRYRLDGDFVKVFITPYKAKITEKDLTFSYGDYNVDFVIAINVPSAGNLDEALREHGRIMHDASAVNITTGQPGRFGEIEWSNPTASSLCEMVTDLIFALQGDDQQPLEQDIATALLTGIVAATDRFSNERTNPDTLGVASKLMTMGADQKLITSNINGNEVIHNENTQGVEVKPANVESERTRLEVAHGGPIPMSNDNTTIPATSANPGASPNMPINPAMQAAPNANVNGNPNPTAVNATNNATPEDVVVQPVIPNIVPNAAPASTPFVPSPPVHQMQIPGVPNTQVPSNNGTAQPANPLNNAAQPTQSAPSIPPVPSTQPAAQPVVDVTQMQLPGATTPAATNSSAKNGRAMATSAPTEPATPQIGATVQPPAPKAKKPKNYAEMMEEALAEPLPGANNTPAPMQNSTIAPNPAPADPSMMSLPINASAQPVNLSTMGIQNTPITSNPAQPNEPIMEPVSNPAAGAPVLPPPPAPNTESAGMMPPILPPVQVPPESGR